MNKEYIEREVAITALENTDWYSINKKGEIVLGAFSSNTALFKAEDIFALLRKVPTEDVTPVRHGEWIHKNGEMYCSLCGNEALMDEVYYESPYCPDCGARMDGGNLNE